MTSFRDTLKSRFAVFGLLVLLILGILLVRLWSMQVLAGGSYAMQATDNRVRTVALDAPRGRIFDRNGKPLVTSRPALAVTMESQALKDDVMVGRLATILGMRVKAVRQAVTVTKLGPLQARVVKLDVPMKTAAYLAEHSAEFPGVNVSVVPLREYPYGTLAAHVLGYVGEMSDSEIAVGKTKADYRMGDIVGKTGAEAQFEQLLRGDRGSKTVEVDAQGTPRKVLSNRDPIGGRDVVLTIDVDIQKVTEQALADAINEAHRQKFRKARAGAAVVMDVQTGEILAMASQPTYDPSTFLDGLTAEQWKSLNDTSSGYPMNNRAIMSGYPPASTFKAVTGMGGLEAGIITPSTTFVCAGKWVGMGTQFAKWCWLHTGHGIVNFAKGVSQSCDVYFYNVGYAFYKQKNEPLQAFARKVGFGSKTGIDLPGEVAGRVPTAKWKSELNTGYPEYAAWVPGDTVNMGIGQGDMLATPLQMCQTYAGIGNNGVVMKPHVLKQVLGTDGKPVLTTKPATELTLPVSAANLKTMQDALVGVTTEGTAMTTFAGFGVPVAGKTGTAQVAKKDDYAWFVGYAPADAPKYAVAVLVEQGGHGASVTGPAARMILAKLTGQPVKFVRVGADQSR
jgi:penicillin-binding protein 2